MPNIMLTDVCNLRCPYCFANEFVNKNPKHITMENFNKALDFIATSPANKVVGLIGGEPTIHPKFQEILKVLISDSRFEHVVIYTNGVALDRYWNELSYRKFGFLINCNPIEDVGKTAYEHMVNNIDIMCNEKYMGDRISLGINIYKPDFDYSYVLDLLKKYRMTHVRFAITVPNQDNQRNKNALHYFVHFKEPLKKFFKTMLLNGITPYYDCNKMPACLIEDTDLEEFKSFIPQFDSAHFFNAPQDNAINNECVHCSPVVDIRHDLTAVRCFGLSEYTKVRISDFACFDDLRNYYSNTVDVLACKTAYSSQCADCYRRKTLKCFGGCLAFKIDDIMKINQMTDNLMKSKEI